MRLKVSGWMVIAACVSAIAMFGCARRIPSLSLQRGTILLLPPRDVVQRGEPHERGAGSGARLLQDLRSGLQARGWVTVVTDSKDFSNLSVATAPAAVSEGKRVGAPYVLQVVLGEFRDAAPMTFRTDFVVLQEARLWDSESGQVVWSLDHPALYATNNLGSYYRLIDAIGRFLVTTIGAPQGAERTLPPTPPRPAAEPEAGSNRSGVSASGCTVEQILSMQKLHLSEEQIKAACEPTPAKK
jgi:hypothetical protein